MIIGRIMQAMGAGIQLPLVAYVPMLVFPREKRGTAMGMAGIVMSCAPAIGPVFAGWIIDRFGWRMMFYSIIPLAIVIFGSQHLLAGKRRRTEATSPGSAVHRVVILCFLAVCCTDFPVPARRGGAVRWSSCRCS